MGYTAFCFQHAVQHWFDEAWLKPGQRLIDFGSQEFFSDPAETRYAVTGLLRRQGLDLEPGEPLPSVKASMPPPESPIPRSTWTARTARPSST